MPRRPRVHTGPWRVERADNAIGFCLQHPEFRPAIDAFIDTIETRSPFDGLLTYEYVDDVPVEIQPGVVIYPKFYVFDLAQSHTAPMKAVTTIKMLDRTVLLLRCEPTGD